MMRFHPDTKDVGPLLRAQLRSGTGAEKPRWMALAIPYDRELDTNQDGRVTMDEALRILSLRAPSTIFIINEVDDEVLKDSRKFVNACKNVFTKLRPTVRQWHVAKNVTVAFGLPRYLDPLTHDAVTLEAPFSLISDGDDRIAPGAHSIHEINVHLGRPWFADAGSPGRD